MNSEDPTTESFKPVPSIKSTESTICFKSRTIGAIEGMYLCRRVLNKACVLHYIDLCNSLNYEGDQYIIEYIKTDPFIKCDYRYENGQHHVTR